MYTGLKLVRMAPETRIRYQAFVGRSNVCQSSPPPPALVGGTARSVVLEYMAVALLNASTPRVGGTVAGLGSVGGASRALAEREECGEQRQHAAEPWRASVRRTPGVRECSGTLHGGGGMRGERQQQRSVRV